MTTAKTFNQFNDVNHRPLKIYNRAVTLMNINTDFGKHVAEDYVQLFSEDDRKDMWMMLLLIKKIGQKEAKKKVTRNLKVVA